MSISWSLRLPETPAKRSPDGDGSIDSRLENFDLRASGARLRP